MPDSRQRVSSGAPWEQRFGYCRAVRSGAHIAVAGTTAVGGDGELVGVGDPYQQTQQCLSIILQAISECGGSLEDVVRTRVFATRIEDWEEIGRAHAEVFGSSRPASTLVEISKLMHPDMLVEIEADAVLLSEA